MVKSKKNNKYNKLSLLPDMCPQVNLEMSFGKGGIIFHNNNICVAKPLLKDSFLYKMFNMGITSISKKKTYLVKEHKQVKNRLDSIVFIAITDNEYNIKRNKYEKEKLKYKM